MQSAVWRHALLAQLLDDDGFELTQLGDRGLDVDALAFELRQTRAALIQSELELANMAGVGLVEVQHLADLGEAEAEPPPAQDQAEPRPVSMREDPRLPFAMRLEQAPVLVEPDGAMRTAELLGEVADGEVALVSFCGRRPLIR